MKSNIINHSFLKLPNKFIDNLMSKLSPSDFKVYLLIFRKTYGYQKDSDVISYSQFEGVTGLSINTVKKSIKRLIRNGYIERLKKGNSYAYRINFDGAILTSIQSNYDQKSEQEMTIPDSQYLTPQYTYRKDIKKTTTNRVLNVSDDVKEIATYWNSLFLGKVHADFKNHHKMISEALQKFSVADLKKAMLNRSKAKYYQEQKPHLRDNPKSFFLYLATIANDLKRVDSKKLYSFEEKVSLITEKGYKDSSFKIRNDVRDDRDRPKWEMLSD